jgi:hypothetical protein
MLTPTNSGWHLMHRESGTLCSSHQSSSTVGAEAPVKSDNFGTFQPVWWPHAATPPSAARTSTVGNCASTHRGPRLGRLPAARKFAVVGSAVSFVFPPVIVTSVGSLITLVTFVVVAAVALAFW